MNEFIINLLHTTSYITAALIIIMGCLVAIIFFLYPIWFLLNTVIYKRVKAATYFMSFIKYRKSFIKWYEEKPNVYTPKVKK